MGKSHRGGLLIGTVVGLLLLAGCGIETHGDAATWQLRAPVTQDSRSVEIGVTRLGCASGVTGEVISQGVHFEPERIVIQVDVEPFGDDAADCRGNDTVPVTIELDQAVGDRQLVDGACMEGEAVGTARCDDAVRWP